MSLKVKKTKAKKQVRRYDEAERTKLLDTYEKLRNAGKTAEQAAAEVDVPYITLRTWQRKVEAKRTAPKGTVVATAGAKASKSKRTTQKAPKGSSPAVTMTLPDGVQVEFATPEDAARFLKAR